MAEVRIGTCSWKYDSWRGIVYPEAGDFDYLQEYAKHFSTVEIDQWFWSLFAADKAVLPTSLTVKAFNKILNFRAGPADLLFELGGMVFLTLVYFAFGVWFFRSRHMRIG